MKRLQATSIAGIEMDGWETGDWLSRAEPVPFAGGFRAGEDPEPYVISADVSDTGTVLTDREMFVYGSAFETEIGFGGIQYIEAAGKAFDGQIGSGGSQVIRNGGTALDMAVGAGGIQIVNGGTVQQTVVSSGGVLLLSAGGACDTLVKSGGLKIVSANENAKPVLSGTTVELGGVLRIDTGVHFLGQVTVSGQLVISDYSLMEDELILDLRDWEGVRLNQLDRPLISGFGNLIDYWGNRKSFTVHFREDYSNGYYSLADSSAGEYVFTLKTEKQPGVFIEMGYFRHLGSSYATAFGFDDKRFDLIEDDTQLTVLVRDRWIVYSFEESFSVADTVTYDGYNGGYRGIFTLDEDSNNYAYNGTAYGGSLNRDLEAGITIDLRSTCGVGGLSAKHHIFGGGQRTDVGGVDWRIDVQATVYSYLVGGGHNGNVTGDVRFDIAGGAFSVIVGGGLANDAGGRADVAHVHMTIAEFGRVKAGQNNFLVGGGYAMAQGSTTSVDSVTIEIDGCSRIDYVYGGGRASGGGESTVETVNLTIDGGNFYGYVNGGGRADGGGRTENGTIHMTVNGGVFNNYVIGGSYANGGEAVVNGDINLTITGGSFRKTVYGGSHSSTAGVCGDVHGDINVTLDARGDNRIVFADGYGVIAGGPGGTNCNGHTTLTLMGNGANITTDGGIFTGWLYGDGGQKDPAKTHTIFFADFVDSDFNASVRGFNNVKCSGNTMVVVNSSCTWGGDYCFDLNGRSAGNFAAAMFTQAAGVMNISEETRFEVLLTSEELFGMSSGEILLMQADEAAAGWSFGAQAVSLAFTDNGTTHSGLATFNGTSLTLGGVEFSFTHDNASGRFLMNFLA